MPPNETPIHFQLKLQAELAARISRNPRYSIRAWSRTLKIDAGTLSRILNGKQIPSTKLAKRILEGIDFSPAEREEFLSSIESAHSDRLMLRRRNFKSEEIYEPAGTLDIDSFHLMAEWYHIAILELTHVPDWNPSPSWISNRLGISEPNAAAAVERLHRLGLLKKKNGKLVKTDLQLSTMNRATTNSALRKSQSEILQKAISSLERDPIESRSMTAMTMAIDPSRLDEARKLIRDFNRKMCALLETGNRERVYTLEIALFSLDRPITETET